MTSYDQSSEVNLKQPNSNMTTKNNKQIRMGKWQKLYNPCVVYQTLHAKAKVNIWSTQS